MWYFKVHGSAYQRPGIPDILVCKDGYFYAFEVKTPGGKPTPLQANEIAKLITAGAVALVVHSLDEVKQALEDQELDLRFLHDVELR